MAHADLSLISVYDVHLPSTFHASCEFNKRHKSHAPANVFILIISILCHLLSRPSGELIESLYLKLIHSLCTQSFTDL